MEKVIIGTVVSIGTALVVGGLLLTPVKADKITFDKNGKPVATKSNAQKAEAKEVSKEEPVLTVGKDYDSNEAPKGCEGLSLIAQLYNKEHGIEAKPCK
jgi:hypothetical protein